MAAVGALPLPELLQLGAEVHHMPTPLGHRLMQLVNDLGTRLMTRVKDNG